MLSLCSDEGNRLRFLGLRSHPAQVTHTILSIPCISQGNRQRSKHPQKPVTVGIQSTRWVDQAQMGPDRMITLAAPAMDGRQRIGQPCGRFGTRASRQADWHGVTFVLQVAREVLSACGPGPGVPFDLLRAIVPGSSLAQAPPRDRSHDLPSDARTYSPPPGVSPPSRPSCQRWAPGADR
jgi:hypothetical protein